MPAPKLHLTDEEVSRPFRGDADACYPLVLSPAQVADLFGLSRKTIYSWIAAGRLDGSFRRRGKHCLFYRDRVLKLIFDGKEW